MEQIGRRQKKSWFIFIIIVVIILLLFSLLAYSYFTKSLFFKEKEKTNDTGYTYGMEELIINLKDGNRYLKTRICLGYGEKKDGNLIKQKETLLIDNIISILRSKTKEEIMPVGNTQNLKEEIKNRLNGELKENIITDIYITDFLVQ